MWIRAWPIHWLADIGPIWDISYWCLCRVDSWQFQCTDVNLDDRIDSYTVKYQVYYNIIHFVYQPMCQCWISTTWHKNIECQSGNFFCTFKTLCRNWHSVWFGVGTNYKQAHDIITTLYVELRQRCRSTYYTLYHQNLDLNTNIHNVVLIVIYVCLMSLKVKNRIVVICSRV